MVGNGQGAVWSPSLQRVKAVQVFFCAILIIDMDAQVWFMVPLVISTESDNMLLDIDLFQLINVFFSDKMDKRKPTSNGSGGTTKRFR